MRLSDLYSTIMEDCGGTGLVIPGVNTTKDVGPNHIQQMAAKFGFKVTKDGIPPLIIDSKRKLINNAKWLKKKNKTSSKSSKS